MSNFKETMNIVRPFYRGLPVIMVIMIVAVIIAKKYLHYATPKYESVALIKLADAQVGVAHSNLFRDFDVFASSNKIGAEVEMVKSQVVVTRALRNLALDFTAYRIGKLRKRELYKDCPFAIVPFQMTEAGYDSTYKMKITNDSLIEITTPSEAIVKGKINQPIKTRNASFIVEINDSVMRRKTSLKINDKYEFIINSRGQLIDDLKSNLDVIYLDKEVPILRIAYKTAVAEKSADIVNAVSEAYIRDYVEEKFVAADTTVDFLNKEVENYGKKLVSSEDAIENFRKKNKIVNLKQEGETDLRSLAELKAHRAGLQMDLLAIDSLNDYVKKGRDHFADLAPNFQTFNDLLSTELLKKIKSLQTDRHDLLLKYTTENDKVKVVDTKLDDLYSYLEESIKNTRENLQIKYDDLTKTIAKSEAAFADFPEKDRGMTSLERQTTMNEQIYRFLHEKRTDAEIAKSANISFHRIISRAEIAKLPISPVPGLIKALAGFLGFLAGVLIIFIVHSMKGRVGNDTNIQKNSDTLVFGRIPNLKNEKISNSVFEKIAIDMQVKGWLEKGSVIALCSFDAKEGKRTAAAGLAKGAGVLGKKILIIDVDGNLNFKPTESTDIIKLTSIEESWKQPEVLRALLNKWKENYDMLLVKNSNIATDASSLLLMNEATMNLMLVDTRLTKLKRIEDTDLIKIELGLDNIQFVVNRDGYTPSVIFQTIKLLKTIPQKWPFKKRTA